MSSKINWLVPDRIVEVVFFDELTAQDLMILHQVDLSHKTKPVYILIDDHNLQLAVPENTLHILNRTEATHPMIGYIAFWGAPPVMEIFTKFLSKLVRMQNKVSFYPTRDLALAKLNELLAQESAPR